MGSNYSIILPPPNITGKLHLGHAYMAYIQDAILKHKSKKHQTRWYAGLDHAGLATHEKILQNKPNDLAYDEFAHQYTESTKREIIGQFDALDIDLSWENYAYTLDATHEKITRNALKKLLGDGLMYWSDNDLYIDMRSLAAKALAKLDKIRIHPESQRAILIHYFTNIEPWCISRSIPWGHKIPITRDLQWNENCSEFCLDTWFSSSLWPLRFPEYPSQMLETGHDIIFHWCGRMIMMCLYMTGEIPFKEIYLHGLLRDDLNRKFSKSLGNGIDPIELLKTYNESTIRWALLSMTNNARDIKIHENIWISSRNWITKLSNIDRFIERLEPCKSDFTQYSKKTKSIIGEFDQLLDQYDFKNACLCIQKYIKHEFAPLYLEESKKYPERQQDIAHSWQLIREAIRPIIKI